MRHDLEEKMFEDLMTPYHLILDKTLTEGAIYLGNQQAVGGIPDKWNYSQKDLYNVLAELKKNGIVSIICCADGIEIFPKDFSYLQIPLRDSPECDISEFFENLLAFVST